MSDSFENLFIKALEAAGHKGDRSRHRRAEKEAEEGARDLEYALEKESRVSGSEFHAHRPHGREIFYSETTGAPGFPIEISTGTHVHGVPEAKFSCFIERGPSTWHGSWSVYVPYGGAKVNRRLKEEISGEISGPKKKVIQRISDAYGSALGGKSGAHLANLIEDAQESPKEDY